MAETDILFRLGTGGPASPFVTEIKVETARLPDGRAGGGGGGGAEVGGRT